MSDIVDGYVKKGFRDAAPYNAEHHDFAWQHRQLARMMSNECPIPPSEGFAQRFAGPSTSAICTPTRARI